MKSVDVLVRLDSFQDIGAVDLLRQGQLHQQTVDSGIGVQLVDVTRQFRVWRIRWKVSYVRLETDFCTVLLLGAYIDGRRSIVADENDC